MTEDLVIDLCALHSARVKELEAMEEDYARANGIDRSELRRMSSPHYMRFSTKYLRKKPSKRREYEDFLNGLPTDDLRALVALMFLGGLDEFTAPTCFLSRNGWVQFPLTSIEEALEFVAPRDRQSLVTSFVRDEMYPVDCLLRGRKRLEAAGMALEEI